MRRRESKKERGLALHKPKIGRKNVQRRRRWKKLSVLKLRRRRKVQGRRVRLKKRRETARARARLLNAIYVLYSSLRL